MKENMINIIGAGAAGLTAAITLAGKGMKSRLIYLEESTMSLDVEDIKLPENPERHQQETLEAGGYTTDPSAVKFLALSAPAFVAWLKDLGAGDVMQALDAERKRLEGEGLITSLPGYAFHSLMVEEEGGEKKCTGVRAVKVGDGQITGFYGRVIMACGGLYGFFPGESGSAFSGDAAAKLFAAGVKFSDLEMISRTPQILCKDGKTQPIRKETEQYVRSADGQMCLDMRGIKRKIWRNSYPGLRKELKEITGTDPKKAVIPVEMRIDYFPGGIDVDFFHQASLHGLFAAGECCSAYNGAGVLKENKILCALAGGNVAASYIAERNIVLLNREEESEAPEGTPVGETDTGALSCTDAFKVKTGLILKDALGGVRNEETLAGAEEQIDEILSGGGLLENEKAWALLAKAMLVSAQYRKESRGLHTRSDFPERDESFDGLVTVISEQGSIQTGLKKPDENGGIPLTR